MEYVYHFKPPSFKGKYIYPLSSLEEVYPTIYKDEVSKYEKGRSKELDECITVLDATWRDVVNLSTLNPIKILATAKLLGNKVDSAEVFKIPISNLRGMKFCLFTDFDGKEKFEMQTIKSYKEEYNIPLPTIEHFIKSREDKSKPLIFEHIPHILVAHEIDVSNVDILKFYPDKLEALASTYCESIMKIG